MPKDKLNDSVGELREKLGASEEINEQSREELEALAVRVETMLQQADLHWEQSLVDSLEKELIAYEEKHPVISKIIQDMLTTLSGMGV